jgi:hypothetical protein
MVAPALYRCHKFEKRKVPDENPEPRLIIELTEPAEAELTEAYQWLWKFGFDVAERWLNGIMAAVGEEARNLASPIIFRRAPVTEGNPYPPRDIHVSLSSESSWNCMEGLL